MACTERTVKTKKSKENKVLAELVKSDRDSVGRILERVNQAGQENKEKYVEVKFKIRVVDHGRTSSTSEFDH